MNLKKKKNRILTKKRVTPSIASRDYWKTESVAADGKEKPSFPMLSKRVCVHRKLPSEVLQGGLMVRAFLQEDRGPSDVFHIQGTSTPNGKGLMGATIFSPGVLYWKIRREGQLRVGLYLKYLKV